MFDKVEIIQQLQLRIEFYCVKFLHSTKLNSKQLNVLNFDTIEYNKQVAIAIRSLFRT